MNNSDFIYKESQFGLAMTVALCIGSLACIGLHLLEPRSFSVSSLLLLCGVFFLIEVLFFRMQTTINSNSIKISFGIGLLKFTFNTSNIESIKEIKTPWYYGWGIRFTPIGRLYNIQGFKAVSIDLKEDGRKRTIIIGTKIPEKLIKAIEQNMN